MCLCQRTQKQSKRSLSEVLFISSKAKDQHTKHDFKVYNADILSSGMRINPIDFSACRKGKAGNSGQCLCRVSLRVKVSLFSLRLFFCTDAVETH